MGAWLILVAAVAIVAYHVIFVWPEEDAQMQWQAHIAARGEVDAEPQIDLWGFEYLDWIIDLPSTGEPHDQQEVG